MVAYAAMIKSYVLDSATAAEGRIAIVQRISAGGKKSSRKAEEKVRINKELTKKTAEKVVEVRG